MRGYQYFLKCCEWGRGGDTARRAEQLVLTGTVKDAQVEMAWVFEQIDSG